MANNITYNVYSQLTGLPISSTDWESAKALREQTMKEECEQLAWFPITCVITNDDGSITMCPPDANGVPKLT